MSQFGDEFDDVLAESSTAADDLPEHEEEETSDESLSVSEGDETSPDKESRTLENVYRETSRKLERQNARVEQLVGIVEQLRADIRGTARQPETSTVPTLERLSIPELEAALNSDRITDAEKPALQQYIQERRVAAMVDEKLTDMTRKQDDKQKRRNAADQALRQYPQLRNPNSEFARAVDQELTARGKGYKVENPFAVLDVANSVAARMGMPASRSKRVPEQLGTNRNSGPKRGNETPDLKEFMPPLEEVKSIAKKLGIKTTDYAKLQRRVAEFRANRDKLNFRLSLTDKD